MRKIRTNDRMPAIDELFEMFMAIKKAEGRAPNTLQQYRNNFGYFLAFLDKHGIERKVTAISRSTIRNYIAFMQDDWIRYDGHYFVSAKYQTAGLAPSTINTRLKTLRVLFRCLYDEGLIEGNPAEGVKNVSEPEEIIVVLEPDEIKRLLDTPNKSYYADFRDYVLMNLLIAGMMRVSEAIHIKKADFNYAKKCVTIRAATAKNRKARTIPLEHRTARLLNDLMEEKRSDFDTDYIFCTNNGNRLDRNNFRKRLVAHGRHAGIKKHVHPHLLRHTAATLFLEAGGDLRHLQLLLGHSDLRSVLRYTHLSGESLRRQHEQLAPMKQILGKRNLPRKIKRK